MSGQPRARTIAAVAVCLLLVLVAASATACGPKKHTAKTEQPGQGQQGGEATTSVEPSQSQPATASAEPTAPAGPKLVNERQPGYVKAVTGSGNNRVLHIDYVQFLTGDAAAEAATAHGDESPPPNDYYIVNDNKHIREFPIKPGITVKVVTNPDGTSVPEGHVITLDAWATSLSGPGGDLVKGGLYWVTIKDSVVVKIEEQYLP